MRVRNRKFQEAFIEFFQKLRSSLSKLNDEELPKQLEIKTVFNKDHYPNQVIVEVISFRDLTQQILDEYKNWPEYRDLKRSFILVDAAGKRFKDKDEFHLNNNIIPQMINIFYGSSGNTFNWDAELIRNQYIKIENGIYRNLIYSVKVPFFNIQIEEGKEIRLKNKIFLRSMSGGDHKLFINLYGNMIGSSSYTYHSNLNTILDIEVPQKRRKPNSIPTLEQYKLFNSLAISLSILKKAPIYYGARCISAKNFWRVSEGTTFLGLVSLPPFPPEPVILGINEVQKLIGFWNKFHKTMISYPWMEIACKRLLEYHQASSERRFDQDHFIDLMTILEILYLPTDEGELKFRLSTSCANLLGKNHQERKTIFDNIRLGYDIRSNLIHAGHIKTSSSKKLNKQNLTIQDLIRAIELYIHDSLFFFAYNPKRRGDYIKTLLK